MIKSLKRPEGNWGYKSDKRGEEDKKSTNYYKAPIINFQITNNIQTSIIEFQNTQGYSHKGLNPGYLDHLVLIIACLTARQGICL